MGARDQRESQAERDVRLTLARAPGSHGDDADDEVRYKRRWSGGRVAEGTRLEIWRTGNRIEGSNPSRSATSRG